MSGSLTCVVCSGAAVVVVVVGFVASWWFVCLGVCCASQTEVFMKSSCGHLLRLVNHLVLPLVRSLCWITQCLSLSFWVAALCEQLVCDCIILAARSVSASGVS